MECHINNNSKAGLPRLSSLNDRAAFTLAEVLITLGIIGVIAALTLPSLIQKYKNQTYVTGLQKGISILNQAFRKAMADDGVTDFGDTELYRNLSQISISSPDYPDAAKSNLGKFLNIIKIDNDIDYIDYLNIPGEKWGPDSANYYLYLADGQRIRVELHQVYNQTQGYARIYLDVNGAKLPNKWGRDWFELYLTRDGVITLDGSSMNGPSYGWETGSQWMNCSTENGSGGFGCAARVVDEGWKMNY